MLLVVVSGFAVRYLLTFVTHEMKDKLDIRRVPQESLGNYHTVGGFVLASLGRIPRKAECFTWAEWEFEVVDVDRNRVDQVLATHVSGVKAKQESQ